MREPARKIAKAAIVASILAVSAALLVPAFTGRPIVSYASSGSMEPTIGVLDVFFVDPWPEQVAVGDIIVFSSVTQGGPAVHRIVGGDADGWITRGDANAGIDQDRGEPPVTRDRILGRVVVRSNGDPVVLDGLAIPMLEARAEIARTENAVGGSRQLAALSFLLIAIVAGAMGVVAGPKRRAATLASRRRDRLLRRLFPRGILGRHVGIALLVALLASTAWAAAHASAEVPLQMVVVADPTSADGVRAAAPGGSLMRTIESGSLGFLPTLVVVDPGDRVAVGVARTGFAYPGASARVVAEQLAGPTSGLQEDAARVWRYPYLLPRDALLTLHDAAPGSPYLVLAAVAASVGAIWFRALGVSRLPVGRLLGVKEAWR